MEIQLYTRKTCLACVKAKDFLKSRSIPFVELVIEEMISRDEVLRLFPGAMSLPICVIDGTWIGGYLELTKSILENEAKANGNQTENQ